MGGETRKSDKVLAIVLAVLLAAVIPIGMLSLVRIQRTLDADRAEVAASKDPQSDKALALGRKIAQNQWDFAVHAAGIGVALAGVALACLVARMYPRTGWPLAAAAVPVMFVVLDAAPGVCWVPAYILLMFNPSAGSGGAATFDKLSIIRFALAGLAAAAYLVIASRLAPRMFYGLTCGSLAAAALFFHVWSPPPPRPVPIAKPLRLMADQVLARMNGMTDAQYAAVGRMSKEELARRPLWTGEHKPYSKKDEALVGADDYLNLAMESPDKQYTVTVYITYNADAMSNIPHVPWICMTQSGQFEVVSRRTDDVAIKDIPGREFTANVLLFRPGPGHSGPGVFMFQYFNAGRVYEHDREVARLVAGAGSHSQEGSFISQTQVSVWVPPAAAEDPTDRRSQVYAHGLKVLNIVVPLLEKEYYPDLHPAGAVEKEGGSKRVEP